MAMSDEVKAGSVVRLKSGGPVMTVAWVEKAGQQYTDDVAHCTWFIHDKEPWKIDERTFQLDMLELLKP
jgi:uncharacterized protein YodC (DUF2158 family)